MVGVPSTNINNVFITLRVPKKYTFSDQSSMINFMKARFSDSTMVPTVYCSQRESPDLDLFDCLVIYSNGIPTKIFNAEFFYNYMGDSGYIKVPINPLAGTSSTRSRRT